MARVRGVVVAAVAAGIVVAGAITSLSVARAEPPPPAMGTGCAPDLAEAMTLLPDETTYAACRQVGSGYSWTAVQTPFAPNDTWWSYGPPITLHGQAMRNPNLSSGRWTATPRTAEAICAATQTTVVEAGVLAPPQVTEGEQGQPLTVEMLPSLFYVDLAGDCLWVKQ